MTFLKRDAPLTRAQSLALSIEESRSDPIAVTELATALAKDWCSQWGGWPSDSEDRMLQIWAHRPMARKMLKMLTAVPKTQRRALAAAVAR